MKKFLKSIVAVTAAASMLLASTAAQVFAAGKPMGDEYELDGLDPSKAKNKPTIIISQEVLPNKEAKANPERRVTVRIKGADSAYANVGFTIRVDDRLTLLSTKTGSPAMAADAWEYCQPIFVPDTDHGFRAIVASSDNVGQDGVMFSFNVKLPDALEKGGKFPIELYYTKGFDLFSNADMDEDGKLMEAWLFTQGIEQGYIEVKPDYDSDIVVGDVNKDGMIDSVDASEIMRVYANASTQSSISREEYLAGDVNNDGKTDSVDASAVLAYYAFISSSDTKISLTDFLINYIFAG